MLRSIRSPPALPCSPDSITTRPALARPTSCFRPTEPLTLSDTVTAVAQANSMHGVTSFKLRFLEARDPKTKQPRLGLSLPSQTVNGPTRTKTRPVTRRLDTRRLGLGD